MQAPPIPSNEKQRLEALYKLNLLDTPPEERFDRIIQLICRILDVPMANFSFIDEKRQWFKSIMTMEGLSGLEVPRDISFCAHTLSNDEIMVIPNARKDERFFDNPMVTGIPNIIFYIGCAVRSPDGEKVGTLCAVDNKPHEMSLFQIQFIRDMAGLLELELTKTPE